MIPNARKLLGWLNPKISRLDGIGGGKPDITPQDVSGALGFIKDDLAREIVCALWWRDGARLTADQLDTKIRRMILDEYARRSLEAQIAKLDCHIVQGEIELRRMVSEADRADLAAARSKRSHADAARWPWNPDVYARMPSAILKELRDDHLCPSCHGIGFLCRDDDPSPIVVCDKCQGSGHQSAPKVARAEALKITEAAYRLVWGSAFEWAFANVVEKENEGRWQIIRQLETIDAATEKAA
jgi:hypothetical protein